MHKLLRVLVLLSGSVPFPAAAQVHHFKLKDEIDGKEVRFVIIKGEDWRTITNEEEITFRCEPYKGVGIILIDWHKLGRHTGFNVDEFIYKVDDMPPQTFNVLKSDAAKIIADFSAGKQVVMKPNTTSASVVPTTRFSLNGSAAAFKTFEGQCQIK